MSDRRFLGLIYLTAAALLVLTGIGCWALLYYRHDVVVTVMLVSALVLAPTAWILFRHDRQRAPATRRRALLVVILAAIVMRLMLIPTPPVSTDIYRYIWDGRVQAQGINPYRYVPADPALASLRDPAIYPLINRAATATSIYPPMAQVIYLAATRIAESVPAMKAAMVAFDLAAIWALVLLLRRRGLPETRVLLYAWHPLALFEFAGSGHIDAAGIGLMLLACLAADMRREGMAGVLLGLATLVKYFPAVLFPALYRRWDWRLPAAMALTVILLYLPYIGVGARVLGYLPGYAKEEGLAAGQGFFLLAALAHFVALPSWASAAYVGTGLAALAALGLRTLYRPAPRAIAPGAALALVAIFTLVLSPHLDWYFTWLLPLLCLVPSAALFYLTAAAPLLYGILWHLDPFTREAWLYLPFILILACEILGRHIRPAMEVYHHGDRLDPAPADRPTPLS